MQEYAALINSTNQNAPFSLCTVGVTRADSNYYIANKNRMTTEFDFVIAGKGTVRCNGMEYRLQAGDVYHLPLGCDFVSFSDKNDPWIKIWVSAYGELLPRILQAYRLHASMYFADTPCYPIFKQILRICRNDALSIAEKEDAVSLLLHTLIRELYRHTSDSGNPGTAKPPDAELLKTYLDNHMCDQVKIKDLSALIFKSNSQTIRIFETAFGMTPYQYLLQLRLASAKQLLSQTNLSVKRIAFSLGFSDEHYFSHLFKSKIGKTPTGYRKSEWGAGGQ